MNTNTLTYDQILEITLTLEDNSISATTGRCVECGEGSGMGTPQEMAHGSQCSTDSVLRLLDHTMYEMRGDGSMERVLPETIAHWDKITGRA